MTRPSTPAPGPGPEGLLDLREMWDALLDQGWGSLALVPTGTSVSVQSSVDALRAALQKAPQALQIIDARGADVAEGKKKLGDLRVAVADGSRAVVLVDSLIQSLAGVHLVQGVDAVVLAVHVGDMDLESLTSSVAMIGPDRILGSFTAPPAA
ncbi:MAG: hypothetical protein WB493_00965 [Anaeromyxobacteraceae bacterium]